MDLKALLPIAIRASLFLLVLALGLRATPADALYVLRRPGLLVRSIVAIDVIVPVVAMLVALALPLAPMVKAGMVLMAASPLPPFVPGKQLKFGGGVSYVCGLLVAVSFLSIITVPATLAIFSLVFHADAWLSPAPLVRLVGMSVVLPLGLGMTLYGLNPYAARRAARVVTVVAHVALAVVLTPVIVGLWPDIWVLVGNGSVLAIVAVTLAALAAGHVLGGPDPVNRTSLAFATGVRHPGIALMIARENFTPPPVSAAIMLCVFASLCAVVLYQVWIRRRFATPAQTDRTMSVARPAFGRSR